MTVNELIKELKKCSKTGNERVVMPDYKDIDYVGIHKPYGETVYLIS